MTLEIRGVTKRVGADTHIHETSLTLARDGFNVLLGETGAGKTTLIKLMAGLEKPTTGRILFDGRDVTDLSPQKRNVSLVHQFFVNYPNLTVAENIASPLRVAGVAQGRDRPPRRARPPTSSTSPPCSAAARRSSPAASSSAPPSPAPSSRTPASSSSTSRSPTSTTSSARSCATSSPPSSPAAAPSSSTPPPSPTRR